MSDSRLVPVLAVAVLVVTVGCTGFLGDDGTASAEEVRQQAVASMADVETYSMQMNMTLETGGQSIEMTMNGTFDQPAKKARMTTTFQGQQIPTYVDGRTMYLQGPQGWQVQELPTEEPWNESRALGRQRAMLESANITELGEDTLDGEPVYVVRIDADPERVKEIIARQQNQNFDGVTMENVTYTQYIHRDTGRLAQVDMVMTMTINGQSVDTDVTISFSDYGKSVDITIPEEAKQSNSLASPGSAVEAAV